MRCQRDVLEGGGTQQGRLLLARHQKVGWPPTRRSTNMGPPPACRSRRGRDACHAAKSKTVGEEGRRALSRAGRSTPRGRPRAQAPLRLSSSTALRRALARQLVVLPLKAARQTPRSTSNTQST